MPAHKKYFQYTLIIWLFIAVMACEDSAIFPRKNLFRTGAVLSVEFDQAQIQGEIVDLKSGQIIQQHGHCWSVTPNPSLEDAYNELGERSTPGSFLSVLNHLNPQQTYYVRAYFVLEGEIIFGEELTLQTSINPNLPLLSNLSIFNINTTQAQIQSQLAQLGTSNVIQYGHCWSTTTLPDLNDDSNSLGTNASEGVFENTLIGLTADTEYYVRAYIEIENNGNTQIIYSQESKFKTAAE